MPELKNETITDRIVGRLRASPLGDLITEEDLHDLVKDAIPRAFFAERPVQDGSWGKTIMKPPIIVEIVTELLRAEATKAAEKWIADNPALVQAQWTKVFETSIEKFVMDAHTMAIRRHVFDALTQAYQTENQQRERQGLPRVNFVL